MTPEFARALAGLLERVGGPDGISTAEIEKELARRPFTLAQSSSPIALTGTTTAKVLASVTIPANRIGKMGLVRISTTWSVSNSLGEKKIITRFGGDDISSNVITTVSTYQEQNSIQNRDKTDEQFFVFGGFAYTGAPLGKLTKDTTLPQIIDIVAQLSDSKDSVTLEAYTIEIIPKP